MNNKERLMIYPYDIQSAPLITHQSLIKNYNITALVSPNGWGLNEKDAAFVYGGRPLGIHIQSDFEGCLDFCDTVLFAEHDQATDVKKVILPKIKKAAKQQKNILCSLCPNNEIKEEISQLCSSSNVHFKHFDYGKEVFYVDKLESITRTLCSFETPVVFVMGASDKTHKFEIQLALRDNFINMGYKVSQIGSRNGCEIFGFHSFPWFMRSTSINEIDRIILFNHYVKQIELRENPDIIIIGIPGGISPFSNELHNNFGVHAFQISQAVKPDAVIFSLLYADFSPDYFQSLSNKINHKFGYEINCFNLSNNLFDMNASVFEKRFMYAKLDTGLVDNKTEYYRKLQIPVYNILNSQDSNNISRHIFDILSSYGNRELA